MNDSLKKHILPAVAVVLVFTLAMPKVTRLNFEYRKGAPWPHETLVAKLAFPVYKTESQMMEDRRNAVSSVVPYYRHNEEVLPSNLRKLDNLGLESRVQQRIASSLRTIYSRGVISSRPEQEVMYIMKGKRAAKSPSSEVFTSESAANKILNDLRAALPNANLDSLLSRENLYDLVTPNLQYDKETTEQMESDLSREISPTSGYVSSGQIIVSEGEIVTPEIAQMLDSYRKEYNRLFSGNRAGVSYWFGCMLVSVIFVCLLLAVMRFSCPQILTGWRRYNYILTVFTITSLVAIILGRVGESLLFIAPFTLCAWHLQAFFKNSEIAPVYAVCLLPLLFVSQNGPALFVMFLAAGLAGIGIFNRFGRGWLQFVSALITFAVLAVSYLGFFLADMVVGNPWRNLAFLFIGSLATVAGYPLVYLFEKIFNLVSSSRLAELCDTSNPVLQELQRKAPGTFQHSLQVMNLCEAVARAIGANVQLVRVGALYHDIGKICNPLCFVENESTLKGSTDSYHSGFTPLDSARSIIRHVSDGDQLARKYRLPIIVNDFIKTHHGTTSTAFFLDRFLKDGGDPSFVPEFSYPGPKPSLKEEIILMLCDSIEAASRSLKEYSPESFDAFVERIVDGKLQAGQFENSDISIQELGVAKDVIKSYLAQMYHGRVAYPEDNRTNIIKLWKQKQNKSMN